MKSLADLLHLRQSSTSSTASTSSSKSFGHKTNRRESFSSNARMDERGSRRHVPTQSMSSSSSKKAESSGRQRAASTGVVNARGYGNMSTPNLLAGVGDAKRTAGRSSRRGASGSGAVVGMMPLAPPADIQQHPSFPSTTRKLHAEHHSTSSIPTFSTLPPLPPSQPRRSIQSLSSRTVLPSPTESTFSNTGSSTASAIALRRRSRARSTSISTTMGLNFAPSTSSSASSTSSIEDAPIELILPPQKPPPVGIPLPATPTPMPMPTRTRDDDDGIGLSSYASCSTIRLGTTPTNPSPSLREDKDSTPTQRTTSTLLSLNLSPPSDDGRGLSRTKRQLSSVSFWKDGLVNELEEIWVEGCDTTATAATKGLGQRREWGGRVLVTSREGTSVVVNNKDSSTEIAILETTDEKSAIMPNSISDISLTNFQFPMPPTHRDFEVPRSNSQVSLEKDLPSLPDQSMSLSASDAADADLNRTPRPTSQTDSARSSVSSTVPPTLSPWLHDRQSSISSLYTSLGFYEGDGGRIRSPTWSSTSESLATPRTPGVVSFDFGHQEDVEQGKGMDRLVSLLKGVGEQNEVYEGEEDQDEAICWGQAF